MKKLITMFFCIAAILMARVTVLAESQDDFLRDLEAGLAARWEIIEEQGDTDSAENRYAYLDAELEHIQKYEDAEFDNQKFSELVHTYLTGLKLQREAVTYFDDGTHIFSSVWDSGLMMRSYAVVDLHDYYGLEISADNLAGFTDFIAGLDQNVTFNITSNTSEPETEHLLDLESLEIEPDEYSDTYDNLRIKVRNVSDNGLTDIGLYMHLLDENGDILRSESYYGSGLVKPGQAITIESYIELKDVAAIEFMYMTYTNENGDYITNTLDVFGENNLEGISDPIVAK